MLYRGAAAPVALLLLLGCASHGVSVGGPSDAAPAVDMATPAASADGSPSCSSTLNLPLPAPVACSAQTEACVAGSDACLFAALPQTLAAFAPSCGMNCGELGVAFVDGCAAEVRVTVSGKVDPPLACLSQAIVGRRWTCAPSNGWVRVFVASCTLY